VTEIATDRQALLPRKSGERAIANGQMETANATLLHYVVDARASRFTVQAFASGILSAMGHNPKIGIRTFTGEVDFNAEALQANRLRLSIKANSLSVLDDISDKDRREIESAMNEQVLESSRYPDIVYEAAAVTVNRLEGSLYSAVLMGALSFHGISRNQSVTARIAVFDEMLRSSGEFTLNQSDYGIKPFSVAGGALKVKDELKFSFEMVARKQE
jgi:polyisoprenoid-binding protein YceI